MFALRHSYFGMRMQKRARELSWACSQGIKIPWNICLALDKGFVGWLVGWCFFSSSRNPLSIHIVIKIIVLSLLSAGGCICCMFFSQSLFHIFHRHFGFVFFHVQLMITSLNVSSVLRGNLFLRFFFFQTYSRKNKQQLKWQNQADAIRSDFSAWLSMFFFSSLNKL